MLSLETFVRKSKLEPSLIELVKMRASQINGCAYCIDMHSKDARAEGETEQRLYALNAWRETPFFTDRERAALAWTEAVTLVAEGHVPDAVFEEVRPQFSDEELVNLTMAVVAINGWNRLAIAFRAVPGEYQPRRTKGGRSTALRILLIALFLAAGASAADDAKVTPLMTKDLTDIAGKEATMLTVEYAPGGISAEHRHNAHTFVYVLEGSVVMQVKGGSPVTLGPGQTFYESPDDVHTVSKNASNTKPAKFLVVLRQAEGRARNRAGEVSRSQAAVAGRTTPRHSPSPMRRAPGSFAPSTKNHFVAVLQKFPRLAGGKFQRLRSFPGDFQKAAALRLFGTGDRAAADQVAGTDRAAVRSVMRDHLGKRPVHRRETAAADADGLRHSRGAQPDFESDIVRRCPPRSAGAAAAADRVSARGAGAHRYGSRASAVTTHGETEVAKFFARNGPSGWYSHACMSRADQSFSRQMPNR